MKTNPPAAGADGDVLVAVFNWKGLGLGVSDDAAGVGGFSWNRLAGVTFFDGVAKAGAFNLAGLVDPGSANDANGFGRGFSD